MIAIQFGSRVYVIENEKIIRVSDENKARGTIAWVVPKMENGKNRVYWSGNSYYDLPSVEEILFLGKKLSPEDIQDLY